MSELSNAGYAVAQLIEALRYKPEGLLWFLKVIWLNTSPEDGIGVLKHVGVAVL